MTRKLLLLEDDKDLAFTRKVNQRYGNQDFLVLTFTPKADLLADSTLNTLKKLSNELQALERVDSVLTILNVPLLESPPKPVKELLEDVPTLSSHFCTSLPLLPDPVPQACRPLPVLPAPAGAAVGRAAEAGHAQRLQGGARRQRGRQLSPRAAPFCV